MKLKAILKQEVKDKNYVEVRIEGDCNDGDYNTTIAEYDEDILEDEDFLKAVFCLEYIENPREDRIETLMNALEISREEAKDFCDTLFDVLDIPGDDYDYCHTITDVSITLYKTDGARYNVIVDKIEEAE